MSKHDNSYIDLLGRLGSIAASMHKTASRFDKELLSYCANHNEPMLEDIAIASRALLSSSLVFHQLVIARQIDALGSKRKTP